MSVVPLALAFAAGIVGRASPPDPRARGGGLGRVRATLPLAATAASAPLLGLAGGEVGRHGGMIGLAVAIPLECLAVWLLAGRGRLPPAGRPHGARASSISLLSPPLIVAGAAFVAGSVLGGLALVVSYGLGLGAAVLAASVGGTLVPATATEPLRDAAPSAAQVTGALLLLTGTYVTVAHREHGSSGSLGLLQAHADAIGIGLTLAAAAAAAVLWWTATDPESEDAGTAGPEPLPELAGKRRSRRTLLLPLAVGVLILGTGAGATLALRPSPPPPITGVTLSRPVPPLPLLDAHGRRTSLAALRGKVVVLSPFLTLCHEVCPLTEGALLQMHRAVLAAGLAGRVRFVEVSVDPWRDSPARLRAFSRLIRAGSGIALLTGSRGQIARFWKFFGVDYWRGPQGVPPDVDWWTHKPERFDVGHTNALFFLDSRGRERIVIVGMADIGGTLSPQLTNLLSDVGRYNLRHPPVDAWTVPQALDDLGRLLGRSIPARAAAR